MLSGLGECLGSTHHAVLQSICAQVGRNRWSDATILRSLQQRLLRPFCPRLLNFSGSQCPLVSEKYIIWTAIDAFLQKALVPCHSWPSCKCSSERRTDIVSHHSFIPYQCSWWFQMDIYSGLIAGYTSSECCCTHQGILAMGGTDTFCFEAGSW